MIAGFFFVFPYLHKKNNLQRAVLEKYLKVNLQFIFYLFFFGGGGFGGGGGLYFLLAGAHNMYCTLRSK